MTYPAWSEMTDGQKFDFLNEWCARISSAIDEQRAVSQSLHERLRQVEAKIGETS